MVERRYAKEKGAPKLKPAIEGTFNKFVSFIPGLPSQDMLREILEFLIGPNDKHLLFLYARSLCKKAIVMIEHPNFALFRISLTPLQNITHIYVQCWDDL